MLEQYLGLFIRAVFVENMALAFQTERDINSDPPPPNLPVN